MWVGYVLTHSDTPILRSEQNQREQLAIIPETLPTNLPHFDLFYLWICVLQTSNHMLAKLFESLDKY